MLSWKYGKIEFANELIPQLKKIMDIYEKNEFIKNLRKEEKDHINNPFWNQFENWIFYQLFIKKEKVKDVFNNLVRKNHNKYNIPSENDLHIGEDPKSKIVKSFFRVCLSEKKEELFKIINDLDDYEFSSFLDVLRTTDYLPIFIHSKSIHENIKSFIKKYTNELNEQNIFILFYKKYFNLEILEVEQKFAKIQLAKLREKDDRDLSYRNKNRDYALISYIIDQFSFEKYLKDVEKHTLPNYYNGLGLYSALFKDFILLLDNKKSIEAILRDFIRYLNLYNEKHGWDFFKNDIYTLWANIFSNTDTNIQTLLNLKNILVKQGNTIFYYKLNSLNSDLFNQIVNESELKIFENEILNWEGDFLSYIDECFNLSNFFTTTNTKKALFYFEKGIIDGILRHGYRKDVIVSYLLIETFEIIWKNNWLDKESFKKYAKQIFNLALHVTKITDGKGTWRGPYDLIEFIAKDDIILAEELKKQLIEQEGCRNISNSLITSVLIGKIRLGFSLEKIEEGMNEYRKDYTYEGKPLSDFYEQKFKVYLNIAEYDFYTDKEKKNAFEKAFNQIEEMKKQDVTYFLKDDFGTEKKIFEKLCKKYKKTSNLEPEQKSDQTRKSKKIENEFIEELKNSKDKKGIENKYNELNNYDNRIVLTKYESWEVLVTKTFDITKNIELFIKYLMDNKFHYLTGFTANSKYLYFGIAVALKNNDMKQEILEYLYENSGENGFLKIMKAYEVLEDKNMCLLLFERYLKFCEFIVN